MQRFVIFLACCLALSDLTVGLAEDDGPAKDVPELKVLEYYLGAWDVAVTNKDSDFTKGESTAKWILGGRFVEQSGFMLSKDGTTRADITTLFTFDTMKQVYRSWMFVSSGSVSQAEMTWDAKSKTMMSVTRPNADGIRSTITADFSEAGKEHWKFVFTDRDGKDIGEMRGENTLRTDKPADTKVAKVATERSAEQKPLDKFLGSWHTEYRMPKAEWTPEEKRGSADLVYTREIGGQYVRERGKHSDQTFSTMLLTFDPDQKRHRGWWFNSQGNTSESSGRWEDASQTFFWTGVESGEHAGTSQHRFLNDTFEWKVLVQDRQKVAMFRVEGSSVRIKDAK